MSTPNIRESADVARLTLEQLKLSNGANLLAFLDMIAWAENGWELLGASNDGYDLLVGAIFPNHVTRFTSYADHPQKFIKINDKLTSSAAGRYMILAKTWDGLEAAHHYGDFSPESQDRGCIELIRGRNAHGEVLGGNIMRAIALCNKEWASFAGSPYGQRTRPIGAMLAVFNQSLEKYKKPDFSNVQSGTATTAPVKED